MVTSLLASRLRWLVGFVDFRLGGAAVLQTDVAVSGPV